MKVFLLLLFRSQRVMISVLIILNSLKENNLIWRIFFTLISLVIAEHNIAEKSEHSTHDFDQLRYIFIDDPVSSLDENHLIQLAVDSAKLIKTSKSDIKFIIASHNSLLYNIFYNELGLKKTDIF